MPEPRARSMDTLLARLQEEIRLLRNSPPPAVVEAARIQAGWGVKSGPTAFVSAYTVSWASGSDGGGAVDAASDSGGVLIGDDGIYEVVGAQRASSTTSVYVTLALNGSRAALENRVGGHFIHDHASAANEYSQTRYVGPLFSGDRVTQGPPTGADPVVYSSASLSGFLQVRRLAPIRSS